MRGFRATAALLACAASYHKRQPPLQILPVAAIAHKFSRLNNLLTVQSSENEFRGLRYPSEARYT